MELLLIVAGLHHPPLSDLHKFHDSWTCSEQQENCQAHLERLRRWQSVRGYEGGRWQGAIEETEGRLRYWELLHGCHHAPGDRWKRSKLRDLYEELGPHRYKEGWNPPLIPPKARFDDPWDCPEMPAIRTFPNGARGP